MLGTALGVTCLPRNNTLCPLYVAQASRELSQGLPVKFYPVNSKQLAVTLSTDLNIVFDALTICVRSTVWHLKSLTFAEASGRRFLVGIGGRIGNPGIQTLSNCFRIEKGVGFGESDYKIVFRPGVCDLCRPICGDVGVVYEDGNRFLGLNSEGQHLLVMFKKVSSNGTRSSIESWN